MRYTKSKPKFILRLYIAGVSVGMFSVITNLLFKSILIYSPGNIIFTFFYTALYIFLIENMVKAILERNVKIFFWTILGIISTFLPQLLFYAVDRLDLSVMGPVYKILFADVVNSVFPPILFVEYSILFIVMGVALYFAKKRNIQCAIFICFCIVSFWGSTIARDMWPFNDFFENQQYWMILALPFIILYNGIKGRSHKAFFYVYYPVHRYLISLLTALLLV